jgi:magnesium transporter
MAISEPATTTTGYRGKACNCLVFRDGVLHTDVAPDRIDVELAIPGTLVWLDVEQPTPEDLEMLRGEFGLHPLATEDLRRPHQRPKLDEYGTQDLVVLFDPHIDEEGCVQLRQVAFFIGPSFLLTVHDEPVRALDDVRARWLREPDLMDPNPLGFLLYRAAAALVDDYFPIADAFEDRLDDIEDGLFRRFSKELLQEILSLRRDLLELRRALVPQRDVFSAAARHEAPITDRHTAAYFTDLVDLILRLTDTVDTMRDRLGAALDSYLTMQSNELNQTMKRLTALTIIMTVPMIVSGVYGMNFERMPELSWAYGYPFALGLIVGGVALALYLFRRNDWL